MREDDIFPYKRMSVFKKIINLFADCNYRANLFFEFNKRMYVF